MLSLLGSFNKQYELFIESFDKLGSKIDDAKDEFNKLTTTRRNKLDTQIKKIEDLRKQQGIVESLPVTEDVE